MIKKIQPNIIINCIGIIKQLEDALNPIRILLLILFFPHKLNKITSDNKIRLIHFSTDCVFNGKKGNYIEKDNANSLDIYGVSKKLGEVCGR